jgi:hypothetical protein
VLHVDALFRPVWWGRRFRLPARSPAPPAEPTAIYTVSIGESIYVIHAFQKKSKAGIATPKPEMELIRQRLKQLRRQVKNAEKRGP